MKLRSLPDTILIINTASIGGTNEFERHILDDQYTLHLWSWRVWQTRSSSSILPQFVKLKSLTVTFLITNTPSIKSAEEFGRHVLDNQHTLHWRRWTIWQTRSWSPIIPPLKRLKSLADTFLITNTPSIEEAEEFDRHVLDHQYSLHWTNWRIWHTRSWSQIIPPLKKLKGLTGTFLITNTPTIEEAEEFDRHVLHHQYSLHWGNWGVWQTRSWSPILPPLKELMSLWGTFLITNIPSIYEAEKFDRHVVHHQYSLHWRSWRVCQTPSWSPILPPI